VKSGYKRGTKKLLHGDNTKKGGRYRVAPKTKKMVKQQTSAVGSTTEESQTQGEIFTSLRKKWHFGEGIKIFNQPDKLSYNSPTFISRKGGREGNKTSNTEEGPPT